MHSSNNSTRNTTRNRTKNSSHNWFKRFFERPEFRAYRDHFDQAIALRTDPKRHGDLESWLALLQQLPAAHASEIKLDQDTIRIGLESDLPLAQRQVMHDALLALSPWRKGPYELFGTLIDTEWRSDWKWQRVHPHISSLRGRAVLDVGCGTGYHCWRMLGDGADYVLGIDPSMRFLIQHIAVQQYADDSRFDFLPIGIEQMPTNLAHFDTVFSMGVLYHRRTPLNHLHELKQLLTAGGELVLETLIVDEGICPLEDGTFRPESRYAQMRNVWSVMTVEKIISLLEQAGFSDARCVNQNITSLDEQRQTPWMQFHSLEQFLDPNDINKTIEGYPAPKRGIFVAKK